MSYVDINNDGVKELLVNNHEKSNTDNGIWAYHFPSDWMTGTFTRSTIASGFKNKFIAAYTGSGRLRIVNGGPVIMRNPFGGYKNTKGMFALRDSGADAESQLPRLTTKYKSRITRRINKA